LWMGQAYVYPGLVPILSVGCFATLVQEPVWALLSGMNVHGRIALAKLIAAAASACLLAVGLGALGWGLAGAAVCFALPQVLVDGLVTPWFACHRLGVSRRCFALRVYVLPLCCAAPFGIGLWMALPMFPGSVASGAAVMVAGGAASLLAYLRWLLPPGMKSAIVRKLAEMRSTVPGARLPKPSVD
jgi:hypothetical protein